MGIKDDWRVIPWGLSLERPAMIKCNLNNIRDLLGHKVDFEFIKKKNFHVLFKINVCFLNYLLILRSSISSVFTIIFFFLLWYCNVLQIFYLLI